MIWVLKSSVGLSLLASFHMRLIFFWRDGYPVLFPDVSGNLDVRLMPHGFIGFGYL